MPCTMNSSDHKALVKLKSHIVNVIREHMTKNGAVESYYNKITGGTGACENVPTAFILKHMPEVSFLSQTDQLLMEAEVLEYDIPAIWTMGRSYRKEPRAGDGRHLSEFALLEYEERDMDLPGLLKFQQELLNICMEAAMDCPLVCGDYKEKLKKYLKTPAVVISYTDVLKKLNDEKGQSIEWGTDFTSSIEKDICEIFDGPVQVTHYPESIKFFNMYRTDRSELVEGMSIPEYNEHKYTVDCVDVLLPLAGETFGAARREEKYSTLVTKLRESIMFEQMTSIRAQELDRPVDDDLKDLAWKPFVPYLELFNPDNHPDRKSVMRSGFGLGMGRLIQFLIGSESVVTF